MMALVPRVVCTVCLLCPCVREWSPYVVPSQPADNIYTGINYPNDIIYLFFESAIYEMVYNLP